MHPFSKEFLNLTKNLEYSDLLEDSEWGSSKSKLFISTTYSELLEDTEWS